MSERPADGLSIRSYLGVLLRWKWVVLGVTIAITVVGSAYTWTRTPMYAATSQLLYVNQIDISNPLSQSYMDTTAQQAEIESAPSVVASSSVQETARAGMSAASLAAGYSVSTVLQPGLNNLYTNVVMITAVSADPAAAADAANAYASAFIQWGRDDARAQVAEAISVVQGQLAALAGSKGTSEYRSLQSTLQKLELLQASVTGSFKVISPASAPSEPFSPRKPRGVVLAFAVGLVLGIALAFVLEQFDTRVHDDEEIADLLGLPLLGHVPPFGRRNRDKGVLLTLSEPSGPTAEAFRVLRSNLDFVSIDGALKTLLVASSVQGEGKSLSACNLAVSMALTGKRVILVDADLRAPRVHSYVGVPNSVGLSSVIARRADLGRALVRVVLTTSRDARGALGMSAEVRTGTPAHAGAGGAWAAADPGAGAEIARAPRPGGSGDAQVLYVLPSGPLPPNPGEMVASERFGEVIASLAAEADIVLVDAPALLPVGDVAALARRVDALVYLVNPSKVRRPALQQARMQLDQLPCRKLGLIEMTQSKGRAKYSGYYSTTSGSGGGGRRTLV